MPHNNTVVNADPETYEVLDQIRRHFNQDWSSDVILRYKSGIEVPVRVIHNVAYHFHNHGTPESRCVVSFIESDTATAPEAEGRAQLLYTEQQKRGEPYVHVEKVHIWTERVLSIHDVQELISQPWLQDSTIEA